LIAAVWKVTASPATRSLRDASPFLSMSAELETT